MNTPCQLDAFQVPLGVHLLSGLVEKFSNWWVRLGNLESATLRDQLQGLAIDRPIYVSGIARAGTTIVLELLSRHPDLATHQYRDFPGQFIPAWWNRGQNPKPAPVQERAHGDRLQVSLDSPEAMEESLWMAFFADLHRSDRSNILDRTIDNPAFEKFYRDHIRKLLLVRARPRYLAKGNYNLTRMAYLQKFLPDARFVVVVRNPREHIASLTKQHRLFCAGETAYPRALAHMQRVGHFEFGLDRRPICIGDQVAQEVCDLWNRGEEVRGTARYWASVYGWLADQLANDSELAAATKIVRYENLCENPHEILSTLLAHCELEPASPLDEFASQIALPKYYTPNFSEREETIIAEETAAVAERFADLCLIP